jgi:hypothetical protein
VGKILTGPRADKVKKKKKQLAVQKYFCTGAIEEDLLANLIFSRNLVASQKP